MNKSNNKNVNQWRLETTYPCFQVELVNGCKKLWETGVSFEGKQHNLYDPSVSVDYQVLTSTDYLDQLGRLVSLFRWMYFTLDT